MTNKKKTVQASVVTQNVLSQLKTELEKVRKKPSRKKKTATVSSPTLEVKPDDKNFIPTTDCVYASLPFAIGGNQQCAISHRSSAIIDCGCDVKVPEGHRLVLELDEELKGRGLDIYKNVLTGETRLAAYVRNVGREIVVVEHRCKVFTMRLEPIYPLTIKVVE